MTRASWRGAVLGALGSMAMAAVAAVPARAQASQPLTQLQFDIVGVRLVVDPPQLTVPKGIATQINTSLQLPAGAGTATADAVAALTQGSLVEATLRGPAITPTRITARPGQPLPLPAFALPGDYFLDGIRLVKDGASLLDATAQDGSPATTIPIAVIDQVMVTSVTSRPLSLDEIREKGIVIDQNNFQAVNFEVAFNIDGSPFTIKMPVALPTRELLNTKATREEIVEQLRIVNQQPAFQVASLPPEIDRPGLNFSIAPLPFIEVPEDGDDPGFGVPPITGLVVIPGNVAFLNQFFSVMLLVNNVAPNGTTLVLRDVRGTVQLPTGLDRVPGASYEDPGDDPLRLARIGGTGVQPTIRVMQAGPDGQFGTADDIETIAPQQSGEGEFLLEGLKEGGHIFDIVIDAVLDGLPSGPVSLVGQAAGAVFVRNPTFSVTLAHPRTVRSGEPYDVYATVTNTSRTVANLVSINLDPLGISGAQLVSDPTVSFETIGAGQSATARFRLVSQRTGSVTASSVTGEAGGGIRLFTGVDERGVPLAPNAIVLPDSATALPAPLVAAAQRVLGQALSIATAPAEALPPDVAFVKKQTVIDRGRALGEAGQRIRFGDTQARVVRDLLIDWLGPDEGFEQLLRETEAGGAFLAEAGATLGLADPLAEIQTLVAQAAAEPFAIVDVVQLQSSFDATPGDHRDPATYGLLVGVLFSKPVTKESGELKTNYQIDANRVVGAAQQGGGRLVYLYLERPIGGLVPRSLTVSDVLDTSGSTLPSATRQIRTVLSDGGQLAGQVREASGSGVPNSVLSLSMRYDRFAFTIATIQVDAQGSFAFDFVPRTGGTIELAAQHPQTLAVATLSARLRGAGETLLLNPTFQGQGTVRGRVLAADGVTPVPHARVSLSPGAMADNRGFNANANELGAFTFTGVPVGVFTLRAIDNVNQSGQTTSVLDAAGGERVVDIVLADDVSTGGRLVGRVFLSDGVTPASGFTVFVGQYDRQRQTINAVDRTTTDETGSFAFSTLLPATVFDVVAADLATGQIGTTKASLVSLTTTAVSIVLEATGAVEGVVFDASGNPLPGALVAGGVALVETDANGAFRIEGVPAGSRTIEAGHPVSRKRGAATVVVLPGQTVTAAITLEARATITGRVLDAQGNPMARVSVRIPRLGGYEFVFTNNQGVYTLPDQRMGDYLIQAPGPSVDSLIAFLEYHGYDPNVAFTSGDGPGAPPEAPSSGNANAVVAAYQNAVQHFMSVDESILGLPDEDRGGFGWTKVRLFQDNVAQVSDIRFLPQGNVSGRTLDAAGNPTGAKVRISALKVGTNGGPLFGEITRLDSDAATGEFSFGRIPRFDLLTFQTAGVRGGDFTLEAAHQFSPVIVQHRGQLNTANPDATGVVLQFPGAMETNGTASGFVLMPDGVTPAPAGTQVAISFGDLTVTTNAEGRFVSQLPIPAGKYRFAATTPSGLRGLAEAMVPAGGSVDVQIRLLGLGNLLVQTRRPNGDIVANATVQVRRGTFPADQADGVTDVAGERRFVNLTEGPFSVEVEEALTGLRGRASGVITRDGETTAVVTITASGRVTGSFLTAADNQPVPFAQVTLRSGSVQAYATTDFTGRFVLDAIPVGVFTVEAQDPVSGRRGRAQGQLAFESDATDVTIVQLPRGTVTGYVLNADGVTGIGGANVSISNSSFVPTRLQVTTRNDGSFRIEGVSAGAFTLESTDPASGARGSAAGTLTYEGEIVDRSVVLEPFGSIRVTVLSETGQPAPNATVTIGRGQWSRSGAVDINGQFTFENLTLGTYAISAVSLADQYNGGATSVVVDEANQALESTITLRGVAPVTVRVLASDAATPVASARVTLSARGGFAGEPVGPTSSVIIGFTDGTGQVTFQSVPLGDYFAKGESGPLAGVVTGSTPGVGQSSNVTVVLGASGTITGRILLPDGSTPAFRSIVTLEFQSQSGLQSGVLQITTDLTGAFSFAGIPLGSFTVGAFEVVSNGVRSLSGSLTSDGQVLSLGDITLDNTGPTIVSISPGDGATGVTPNAPVVLTFSEPMRASSITSLNVKLLAGTTPVPGTVAVASNGLSATFTPLQPLTSNALYTLSVSGSPAGPVDEQGLSMVDAFISTFRVADVIPPVITSVFPAANAREVVPSAVVRVTFSEPVASANVVLRTSAGAVVPAQAALVAGGTAIALSPVDYLPPNAAFVTTVHGAVDTAGNPLAGTPQAFPFFTVDTMAPILSLIEAQGTPRAGATITLVPTLVGDDVARVEYVVSGSVGIVASAAPFSVPLVVPAGVSNVAVSATAVDHVGNRSSAFALDVPVLANEPPAVTLVNVSGLTIVPQGAAVSFDVEATDDVGLGQILLSSVGAVSQSFTQTIAGAPVSATRRFTVNVPADATPGGTFTIQAAAIDSAGTPSAPVTLTLTVRDGVAPAVSITAPAAGTPVVPGQILTVVVTASDPGGVASMTLTCSPALSGCETRAIGEPSTTQTFTVAVPDTLHAPATLLLSASATDAAGNIGQAGRSLPVADVVAPVLTTLVPISGSTNVIAGTTATLTATATDNVGVVAVDYVSDGALTTTGSAPVTPAATTASVSFGIAIPAGTANGGTIAVRARARDAAGNLGNEILLTLTVGDTEAPVLTVTAPTAGAVLNPGQPLVVQASATDDVAVARFVVTAAGVITFSETREITPAATPASATFTIPNTGATPAGDVTITVRALDAAGNASSDIVRVVSVRDAAGPDVGVTSPLASATIDPRESLSVVVNATDDVSVAEVGLTTSGAIVGTTTRPIAPAQASATETFTLTFATLPSAGGTLTLTGTARDTAGNQSTSTPITVTVLDVVAPTVTSVSPGNGATSVALSSSVVVSFSEPMDRATLTASSIRLSDGATPVPVALAIAADDRSVTLTPSSPLTENTLYTVSVDAGVRDKAANALTAAFASTFRTISPDVVAPKVLTTVPANASIGVGTTAPFSVTFTEAIAPASITPTSFRVTTNAAVVPGTFAFGDGGATVRFTPTSALPYDVTVVVELTGGITDVSGNALVNADDSAITTPITFTYQTGAFSIVAPDGASVIEENRVTFEAMGAASLEPASVVFTVNGVALPAVAAEPFRREYTVPLAATASSITVVASARNASNLEIASATRTYDVLRRLRATPTVLGLQRGATKTIRLTIAEALTSPLTVAVASADAAVATVTPSSIVLPAGQTSVDLSVTACTVCPGDPASVTGAAIGNTAIVASSDRGTAATSVSVSDRVDPANWADFVVFARTPGVSISLAPTAGQVVLASGQAIGTTIAVLSHDADGSTAVSITSSNPGVATATASNVATGTRTTTLAVQANANGIAVLTIRAGGEVRTLTVYVGAPPDNLTPVVVAPQVGVTISRPPSAGQILLQPGQGTTTSTSILLAPATGPTPVTVASSNPAIAMATATTIGTGSQTTSLAITTGEPGIALLTIRAGGVVRSLTVYVGAPPANDTPMVLAPSVGVTIALAPSVGQLLTPTGGGTTTTIVGLLPSPAGSVLPVSVESSNPAIASATAAPVAAGQQVTTLTIDTGIDGIATLTLRAGGVVRSLTVYVGEPPASMTPVYVAPPVGITAPKAFGSRVIVPAGNLLAPTIGVQLLAAPLGSTTAVTVTTSNPAIASFGAATSMTLMLQAGDLMLPVLFETTGEEGSAVLTFEFNGITRQLEVVVGNPPASAQPAIVAPVAGIQVQVP